MYIQIAMRHNFILRKFWTFPPMLSKPKTQETTTRPRTQTLNRKTRAQFVRIKLLEIERIVYHIKTKWRLIFFFYIFLVNFMFWIFLLSFIFFFLLCLTSPKWICVKEKKTTLNKSPWPNQSNQIVSIQTLVRGIVHRLLEDHMEELFFFFLYIFLITPTQMRKIKRFKKKKTLIFFFSHLLCSICFLCWCVDNWCARYSVELRVLRIIVWVI